MSQLLATFGITEIILVVFLFALAVKEVVSLWGFFRDLFKKSFKKEADVEDQREKFLAKLVSTENKIDNLTVAVSNLQSYCESNFNKTFDSIKILTDSDKDDIKSWIVAQYHYFTEGQKWIDDFSMDVIERRYEHYTKENGNSYVHTLMEELRQLPKHPPKEDDE